MKISTNTFQVHQMNIAEVEALETVYKLVDHIQDSYGERCVLMSPNDGEVVTIEELPRVKGVLSFLMTNRVVEVCCS